MAMMQSCDAHPEAMVVFQGNGFANCPVCDTETNLSEKIQQLEADVQTEQAHSSDLETEIEALKDEILELKKSQEG